MTITNWFRRRKTAYSRQTATSDQITDATVERQSDDYLIDERDNGWWISQCGHWRGPFEDFGPALRAVVEHANANQWWPEIFVRDQNGAEKLVDKDLLDAVVSEVRSL